MLCGHWMFAIGVLTRGKYTDWKSQWNLHGRGGERVGKVWEVSRKQTGGLPKKEREQGE